MTAPKNASADSELATTIMVRNIPRHYAARELAKELRRLLAPRDIDFVYVPWDKTSTTNMGFGFANLRSVSVARSALLSLASQPWRFAKRNNKMQVQLARVHGLAPNLQRFKRDVADRGGLVTEHAPIVFEEGVALTLDEAFAKYCPEGEMAGEAAPPVQVARPRPARAASNIASEAAQTGHVAQPARQYHQAGVPAPPGLDGASRKRSREMLAQDRQDCDVVSDRTYFGSFRAPPGLEDVLPMSPPGLSVSDGLDGGNSGGGAPGAVGMPAPSASFQAEVSHGCDYFFGSDSDTDMSDTELMSMEHDFSSWSDLPSYVSWGSWASRSFDSSPHSVACAELAWLGSVATCSSLGSIGPWPCAKLDMLTNGSVESPVPTLDGLPGLRARGSPMLVSDLKTASHLG